jgi:hypothetical protein
MTVRTRGYRKWLQGMFILQLLMAPGILLDQQAGGLLHLLLKEIFYGFSTVDARLFWNKWPGIIG